MKYLPWRIIFLLIWINNYHHFGGCLHKDWEYKNDCYEILEWKLVLNGGLTAIIFFYPKRLRTTTVNTHINYKNLHLHKSGAYLQREICVSKSIGLASKLGVDLLFLLCIWEQFSKLKGRFNRGIFSLRVWEAYIWRGLFSEDQFHQHCVERSLTSPENTADEK